MRAVTTPMMNHLLDVLSKLLQHLTALQWCSHRPWWRWDTNTTALISGVIITLGLSSYYTSILTLPPHLCRCPRCHY